MAHTTNSDHTLNTETAMKTFRQRLEEIEEALVREAQEILNKGHVALAKPLLERANRIVEEIDFCGTLFTKEMFHRVLRDCAAYTNTQIATEVTLVRCRLADVPEAWDMGGQASTRTALPAAA